MTSKEKTETIANNILYEEELVEAEKMNPTKKQIEEAMKKAKEIMLADDSLKEIVKDALFMGSISKAFLTSTLDADEIKERYGYYQDAIRFMQQPNAEEILKEYNEIITADENGFYKLGTRQAQKLLSNMGLYVEESQTNEVIKMIWQLWENQKQMITVESLNNYSKKDNGLEFKYFMFVEEYIKTGRITTTCKNIGISRMTAYEWLKKEEVNKYLISRQEEIKAESKQIYENIYNNCFENLNKFITNDYSQEQLKAIDIFLKHYEAMNRAKTPSEKE